MARMKRPVHVALNAHLLSGEASYRSAGIHGYLLNTLLRLPDADPDARFTAFVGQGRIDLPPRLTVRRSRLPTGSPLMRILWEQAAAPLALARLRPDLLHGMAFSLPVLWRGPSVVTIFDLSFLRYPERLSRARRLYLGAITRLSARRARRVIAISESGKAEMVRLLDIPEDKIDVAVPGVNREFHRLPTAEVETFRQQQGLPERFILYVGTLEPRKNLETLMRAYARLTQRKRVKLALVGATGWQFDSTLRLIGQMGLQADILMPGFVRNEELSYWYSAAEVFGYPSIYEGFGLPILEAMACGLPVIASDSTSLPEAVGPDGLLVPPTDVAAWADALSSLLENPDLRANLAERGRLRAGQFTWARTARQTVATYHKALG